jgi:hypothetical protein
MTSKRNAEREQKAAGAILDGLSRHARFNLVVIMATMACGDLIATAIVECTKRSLSVTQGALSDADFVSVCVRHFEAAMSKREAA